MGQLLTSSRELPHEGQFLPWGKGSQVLAQIPSHCPFLASQNQPCLGHLLEGKSTQ